MITHEEFETGSAAAQWLVERDLAQLALYIEFLETLDLDHTVAQVDVVLALARRYTSEQLRPLTEWAEAHHAQLLTDWLRDDRAWKD